MGYGDYNDYSYASAYNPTSTFGAGDFNGLGGAYTYSGSVDGSFNFNFNFRGNYGAGALDYRAIPPMAVPPAPTPGPAPAPGPGATAPAGADEGVVPGIAPPPADPAAADPDEEARLEEQARRAQQKSKSWWGKFCDGISNLNPWRESRSKKRARENKALREKLAKEAKEAAEAARAAAVRATAAAEAARRAGDAAEAARQTAEATKQTAIATRKTALATKFEEEVPESQLQRPPSLRHKPGESEESKREKDRRFKKLEAAENEADKAFLWGVVTGALKTVAITVAAVVVISALAALTVGTGGLAAPLWLVVGGLVVGGALSGYQTMDGLAKKNDTEDKIENTFVDNPDANAAMRQANEIIKNDVTSAGDETGQGLAGLAMCIFATVQTARGISAARSADKAAQTAETAAVEAEAAAARFAAAEASSAAEAAELQLALQAEERARQAAQAAQLAREAAPGLSTQTRSLGSRTYTPPADAGRMMRGVHGGWDGFTNIASRGGSGATSFTLAAYQTEEPVRRYINDPNTDYEREMRDSGLPSRLDTPQAGAGAGGPQQPAQPQLTAAQYRAYETPVII